MRKLILLLALLPVLAIGQTTIGPYKKMIADTMVIRKAVTDTSTLILVLDANGRIKVNRSAGGGGSTDTTGWNIATKSWTLTYYEPKITAGTTGQYWRGDKTWQTLPVAASVDSVPFQRNAPRGVTFLRNGTDKVAIGSTATPDSTLKVTGGVNVTQGLNTGYDTKINLLTIGRGGGGVVTNLAAGYVSLFYNTTGSFNTGLGYFGLASNSTGKSNTGVGAQALGSNNSGNYNTATGRNASGRNESGYSNTSNGIYSLFSNTTGHNNIALGDSAGYAYTTLSNRMYLGARDSTTTGIYFNRTTGWNKGYWNGKLNIKTVPYSASPTLKVVAQDTTTGDLYRTTVTGGTTYTATSPMSVAGNDVHILSDTLADWRAKMNAVAAKQDSTANPWMYSGGFIVDRKTQGSIAFNESEAIVYATEFNATGGNSYDWNTAFGWGNHASAGYMTNPMTTNGDLIYQHPTTPTRIPIGTLGQRLQVMPDDGNGLTLGWATPEWLTSSGNAYRSSGNIGFGTSTPMHKVVAVGSKATNLNMLNLVSSDWNKSRTSVAQATDTASANFAMTDGGKPLLNMKDNAGNNVMSIDSAKAVTLGATGAGANVTVNATLGGELAPALSTPNWTLGSGWAYLTSPARIAKTGSSSATATPASMTITAGMTYKVTITINSSSCSGIQFWLGGVQFVNIYTNTGTYTYYVTALTTDKLTLYPANGCALIEIGAISVTAITTATGDVSALGHIKAYSPIQDQSGNNTLYLWGGKLGLGTPIPAAPITIKNTLGIAPAIRFESNDAYNVGNSIDWADIGQPGGLPANFATLSASSVSLGGFRGVMAFSLHNGTTNTEMVRFTGNGTVGIGTTAPSYILSLSGQAAQTFGMERMTTSNTAGNSLSIRAGGSTASSTDKLGGPLYYYPGISTGNATGVAHQWYTYDAGSTGTTDQTATAKMTLYSSGILDVPKQKHSATDTTGMGSTANVGMMMYYNGHFYGLIAGTPPTWKQLDN